MKNERGEITLMTVLIILGVIVILLVGSVFIIKYFDNRKTKLSEKIIEQNSQENVDDWKLVDLGEFYKDDKEIELDLDGDGKKENIIIITKGKFISINDSQLIVNKYYKNENNSSTFEDYIDNSYYFVDLNNDGIIEIIHKTKSFMISPVIRRFTIYNYTDEKLKEIGAFEITGSDPKEVYVKNNNVKFEYRPDETPEDYKESVKFKLEV